MKPRTLAAVDIGTNSVKLLVARAASAERVEVLHQEVAITRIGQGLGASGRLSPVAAARTRARLLAFARTAARLGAERVRAVATSALRDARQGPAFVADLARRTGWQVEVITGAREAELGWRGAVLGRKTAGPRVVFDVGGGSAQISVGDATGPTWSRSFPLGAVRLTERWLPRHPVPLVDLVRLGLHVAETLLPVLERFHERRLGAVIGIGGTLACLSALDLSGVGTRPRRRRLKPGDVHDHRLTRGAVKRLLGELSRRSVAERKRLPNMDPGRADVIVAGAATVAGILDALGARGCRVSTHGIRFGLLAEMIGE